MKVTAVLFSEEISKFDKDDRFDTFPELILKTGLFCFSNIT